MIHEALVEKVTDAMREKRAELIALPLQRIWPELARAALSVVAEAPREPTEAMIEAGSTAKLNHERAVAGLMPVALSDLEADDADLYRLDAFIVLRAALSVSPLYPKKDGGNDQ